MCQYVLDLNPATNLRTARQLGISRSTLYRILGNEALLDALNAVHHPPAFPQKLVLQLPPLSPATDPAARTSRAGHSAYTLLFPKVKMEGRFEFSAVSAVHSRIRMLLHNPGDVNSVASLG